jgi:hypothetical protein
MIDRYNVGSISMKNARLQRLRGARDAAGFDRHRLFDSRGVFIRPAYEMASDRS